MQALEAIDVFSREMRVSPTLQELADRLKVRKTAAFQLVAHLKSRGLVEEAPVSYRNLLVTRLGLATLREHADSLTEVA